MFAKLKKGFGDWLRGYERIVVHLPNDMIVKIFKFMKYNEFMKLARTSQRWKEILKQDYFWFALLEAHYPDGNRLYPWKKFYTSQTTYKIFHDNIHGRKRPTRKLLDSKWFMIEYCKEPRSYIMIKKDRDEGKYWYAPSISIFDKEILSKVPDDQLKHVVYGLSRSLMNTPETVERILEHVPSQVCELDYNIQNDPKVFLDSRHIKYITSLPIKDNKLIRIFSMVRDNVKIMKKMVKKNSGYLLYSDDVLRGDKNFIMSLDNFWYLSIQETLITLIKDTEILKFPILNLLSYDLQNDKDVVLKAVRSYWGNFRYASPRLKEDKDITSGRWYRKYIGAGGGGGNGQTF